MNFWWKKLYPLIKRSFSINTNLDSGFYFRNKQAYYIQTKKSKRYCGNNKSCKRMSLYDIYHLVEWWSHLHCFLLLFFFAVERGGREITSWQLQTPTDSLTWHITTAKKTTPIQHRCSWAQKANVIRCESRSHANQAKVIHVEGLTLCCQKCFWYQPPRNASSPANLALSCKTNIKVGTGEDSC